MQLVENEVLEAILQPIRFKIISVLLKNEKPMYIEQIAKNLDANPRLIAHHLEILEDKGLVESKFEIIESKSRPVAGRFFSATQRAKLALTQIGRGQTGEG